MAKSDHGIILDEKAQQQPKDKQRALVRPSAGVDLHKIITDSIAAK